MYGDTSEDTPDIFDLENSDLFQDDIAQEGGRTGTHACCSAGHQAKRVACIAPPPIAHAHFVNETNWYVYLVER